MKWFVLYKYTKVQKTTIYITKKKDTSYKLIPLCTPERIRTPNPASEVLCDIPFTTEALCVARVGLEPTRLLTT